MYHFMEGAIIIERVRRHFNWDKFSLVGKLKSCFIIVFYSLPEKLRQNTLFENLILDLKNTYLKNYHSNLIHIHFPYAP